MGKGPKKIPHRELWSNPEAETYLTGIDYYKYPKLCREKLSELYPQLNLPVPKTDAPIPKIETFRSRWGDGETYGGSGKVGDNVFNEEEDVFNFSPLANPDFRRWGHVVMPWDFSTDETIKQHTIEQFRASAGKEPPLKAEEGSTDYLWFYNTLFMWPLLTFGWDLFLRCCLDDEFDRIMAEFAEINRRVFKVFADFPCNFVFCHDDLATSIGPVCPPSWMRKNIYPYYEEFFSIMKAGGKRIIFICDGNSDGVVDDLVACGADGLVAEPFTDIRGIAKKHKDIVIAGEGDNRILMGNDKAEIRTMVEQMVETAQLSGGYLMSIGNHIPFNVPPEAIKTYLDLADELAYRK